MTRLLQIALVLSVFLAVCLLSARSRGDEREVLPETGAQFSLDLEVTASLDHEVVYAVEQRARPAYRIFSFDPATGEDQTVFEVPDDAVIFGISLHPDRRTLAVAYSPDFELAGTGLWLLDLESNAFSEVHGVQPAIYFADPAWGPSGNAVFLTEVDRGGEVEQLRTVSISTVDGSKRTLAKDAISPSFAGEALHYLEVDEDGARRAVGIDGGGTISIGDGVFDLDHLVASPGGELSVAVIEVDDGDLGIGQEAGAHGSHDVAARWWVLDHSGASPTGLEPIIVHDAVATRDGLVYATSEGLSISDGDERVDVIASRAIRLVAG